MGFPVENELQPRPSEASKKIHPKLFFNNILVSKVDS